MRKLVEIKKDSIEILGERLRVDEESKEVWVPEGVGLGELFDAFERYLPKWREYKVVYNLLDY